MNKPNMKKQISYRKLVGLTFILMMLTQVYGVWQVHSDPVSPNIALDDTTATATYTVKTDGSGNFWALRYDGYKMEESTDYATTINWAITSTNSLGGGKVLLNVIGEYTITTSIVMKSDVTLQGLGMYVTSLKAKNALDDPVIVTVASATPYTGIAIMDLEVNGNKANQATPGGSATGGPDGLHLDDCTDPVVQRCYIHDVREYGIWMKGQGVSGGVIGGEISSCHIEYCPWAGIVVGGSGGNGPQRYARVFGNYIGYIADVGISIQSKHVICTGNTVYYCQGSLGSGSGNSGYGIDAEATGMYSNIAGNVVYDCDQGIIVLSDSNHILISSNLIDGCDYSDILIHGDWNTISGNRARGSAKFVNLIGASTPTDNDILNNECRDATVAAIYIDDTVTDVSNLFIDGNDFKGCTSNGNSASTTTPQFGYNRWANGTYGLGHP